ncbi:MAG: hypothetical protein C0524_14235 [Rhodobacter sp.]|nr:hypothetical protein [Rhodobacter sp.]
MRALLSASLILGMTAAPTLAQVCGIDAAALGSRLTELEQSYPLVLSDIGCENPTNPAQQILCDSADQPDRTLWQMGQLDTLAWVYAVENATGREVDQENPPLDQDFIAQRDACTGEACLCEVLIGHTNASLGGTSPYPQ